MKLNLQHPERHISYLQAEKNYTFIFFKDGTKFLSSYTLKSYEEKFAKTQGFSRIHRKYLVNNNSVITRLEDQVRLFGGKVFPMSRRKRENLGV